MSTKLRHTTTKRRYGVDGRRQRNHEMDRRAQVEVNSAWQYLDQEKAK